LIEFGLCSFLFKTLPFDLNRLMPVSQLFFMSQVFAVSSALGVKSLPELAAHSKANSPNSSRRTAPPPGGSCARPGCRPNDPCAAISVNRMCVSA
jgi:tripartite-type tricarboxylate transporter receptor subunit TctC